MATRFFKISSNGNKIFKNLVKCVTFRCTAIWKMKRTLDFYEMLTILKVIGLAFPDLQVLWANQRPFNIK